MSNLSSTVLSLVTISDRRKRFILTTGLTMLLTSAAQAAESADPAPALTAGFWDLLIAVFVCLVAASVAYLCYGAVRLWLGYWRLLAIAPLALVGIWLGFAAADFSQPNPLWTFELLAWAMATTVYLVVLFTARRTFEKAAIDKKFRELD
jgi:hypothetical protein